MTFSDALRRIIRECGKSRYQLSQETGVAQSVLSRFMAGLDLNTSTIDALAPVLGIEVVTKLKSKPKSRKG